MLHICLYYYCTTTTLFYIQKPPPRNGYTLWRMGSPSPPPWNTVRANLGRCIVSLFLGVPFLFLLFASSCLVFLHRHGTDGPLISNPSSAGHSLSCPSSVLILHSQKSVSSCPPWEQVVPTLLFGLLGLLWGHRLLFGSHDNGLVLLFAVILLRSTVCTYST